MAGEDEPSPPCGVSVTVARPDDASIVRGLLVDCGLPHEDIGPHLGSFLLAWEGRALVGSVGLELAAGFGLLRSLAVVPRWRGRGLGRSLCQAEVIRAQRLGLSELWLLTTTAETFFARLGFSTASHSEAPGAVRATAEFAGLCPATSVCMHARLPLFPS